MKVSPLKNDRTARAEPAGTVGSKHGLDLNQRPLGYESHRDRAGNPLISRRMSRTTSNYRFLSGGPSYLSFEDVSRCYGSRTGADDPWVLPKPLLVPFTAGRQPCHLRACCCRQPHSNPYLVSATRLLKRFAQLRAVDSTTSPRDLNSEGILIPARASRVH